MFGSLKKNKKIFQIGNHKLSAFEIAAGTVLSSIKGENYIFLDMYSKMVSEGKLLEKAKVEQDYFQIIIACANSSAYFIYLLIFLKATEEELNEYYPGLKAGFEDVVINNERAFSEERINHIISFFKVHASILLNEVNDIINPDPNEFKMGGYKSSIFLVKEIYKHFKIDYESESVETSMEKIFSEKCFDIIINDTLETATQIVKRV